MKTHRGRATSKGLVAWADSPCPTVFDPKTAEHERRLVSELLPLESADLTADEAQRVAARIMAARLFVLTKALGSKMSDVMRAALAGALLLPEYAVGSPLRYRFLSKALYLAPGPEVEAFERRANQLFVPLPKILERASTLPCTPGLVAAAQAACATFDPSGEPVELGIPSDWLVFVLLARDGSRASADAVRAVVQAQESAAARVGNAELRCADVVARIASIAKTRPFEALAKELATLVVPRVETATLLTRIAPRILESPKWRVEVWIGVGDAPPDPWFGMRQEGPRIHLALRPDAKHDWKLDLRGEPRGLYSSEGGLYANWAGGVSQDDFGLPPLTKLEDFPAWLPSAGAALGVTFAVDAARIDVGRLKSCAPLVRAWLAGADARGPATRGRRGPSIAPMPSSSDLRPNGTDRAARRSRSRRS